MERMRRVMREPVINGPAVDISPLDPDAVLARWRGARDQPSAPDA